MQNTSYFFVFLLSKFKFFFTFGLGSEGYVLCFFSQLKVYDFRVVGMKVGKCTRMSLVLFVLSTEVTVIRLGALVSVCVCVCV